MNMTIKNNIPLTLDLSYLSSLGIDATKLKPKRLKGRPRRTTHEQEKAIIELEAAGFGLKSIAEAIQLSLNTVSAIVERHRNEESLTENQ